MTAIISILSRTCINKICFRSFGSLPENFLFDFKKCDIIYNGNS